MPYYLLPIFAFFAFLFERSSFRKPYKLLLFLAIFSISFVACFRGYGIGTDYIQYLGYFEAGLLTRVEPVFNIISVTVNKITGGSYQIFISVFFLLSYFLRYFVFKKISYSLAISLMAVSGFWFLVYDMNGIRQGLSLSFVAVAIFYTYKKNLKMYFVFALLAVFSHYSSVVFLPFYFLMKINFSKTALILLISFSFLLNLFGISEYLFSLVMQYGGGVFSEKSTAYSQIDGYNSNALFSFGVLHRLAIFLITMILVNKIPADARLKKIFMVAAFINFFVYLTLSRYELIATRGSLSYRFVECIFFSYIPFIYKDKFRQNLSGFILLLYIILQIFLTLQASSSNTVDNTLIPYRTFFE